MKNKIENCNHFWGYKVIGGFPGHGHIHPTGELCCLDCEITLRKYIESEKAKDYQKFIEILERLKEKEIEVDADEVVKGSLVGITSWNAHIRGINQKIQEAIKLLKR